MGFHYDPQAAPDPKLWLAMSDQDRLTSVLAWHEASTAKHPPIPRLTLHAAMHTVVETQAALDRPVAVGLTLARLAAAGLDRHWAVHAVASVAGDTLSSTLADGKEFDEAAYGAALAELSPADWRL